MVNQLDVFHAEYTLGMVQLRNHFRLKVQCSPFMTLYLGSMGTDCVISESCYKGTIFQRNYRKIPWSFSTNYVVKFHVKKTWELQQDCVISESVL